MQGGFAGCRVKRARGQGTHTPHTTHHTTPHNNNLVAPHTTTRDKLTTTKEHNAAFKLKKKKKKSAASKSRARTIKAGVRAGHVEAHRPSSWSVPDRRRQGRACWSSTVLRLNLVSWRHTTRITTIAIQGWRCWHRLSEPSPGASQPGPCVPQWPKPGCAVGRLLFSGSRYHACPPSSVSKMVSRPFSQHESLEGRKRYCCRTRKPAFP